MIAMIRKFLDLAGERKKAALSCVAVSGVDLNL